MKTLTALLVTALMISPISTGTAYALPPSGATEAPDQLFAHPSDDKSYSEDTRDDETPAKARSADNGTVQYVSGGVGESGMRAIDAEEHAYNLKMLFVAEGEYLADVSVNITDKKGNSLLNTTTEGPVLLVNLPPGHYTVSTKAEGGSTLTRRVEVGKDRLASYVLRYPAREQ